MISIILGGVIELCQQHSGATRYQISIRACHISVTFVHGKQLFINTKEMPYDLFILRNLHLFVTFLFFCSRVELKKSFTSFISKTKVIGDI